MPGLRRTLTIDVDTALARLPEALKSEGFGVLSDIDVEATLRAKLGAEIGRYRILGACNPSLALRAITAERDVGVMLPCNVVVREEDGHAVITAVDPLETIAAGHEELRPIATEVRERLLRAIERV